jgi:hypothetical protein
MYRDISSMQVWLAGLHKNPSCVCLLICALLHTSYNWWDSYLTNKKHGAMIYLGTWLCSPIVFVMGRFLNLWLVYPVTLHNC